MMWVVFVGACWVILFSVWALISLFDLRAAEVEHELLLDELWDDGDLAVSA